MSDERQGEKPDRSGQEEEGGVRPARRTILIVEDDDDVRDLLQEAFSIHGYRTIAAATVEEAENNLQRSVSGGLELVVTDVHLTADPQAREGYELYRRWSAVRPELHFLLISGNPASRALPIIRSGAVPFLMKPFTIDALLKIVRQMISG